jgi:16S rRNA (cytosine967-C5)-methyltransferase
MADKDPMTVKPPSDPIANAILTLAESLSMSQQQLHATLEALKQSQPPRDVSFGDTDYQERLRENLARLQLQAEIVTADAASWKPPAPFDAILLDAPCTATGTIRRHPDVAWLKRPRDVATAAALQSRLLQSAAAMLAPGGRLVFATCSLQAEEGEAHLREAAALGLRLDPIRPEEVPGLSEAILPNGALRTRPDYWAARGGMDGFFIARFVKG